MSKISSEDSNDKNYSEYNELKSNMTRSSSAFWKFSTSRYNNENETRQVNVSDISSNKIPLLFFNKNFSKKKLL